MRLLRESGRVSIVLLFALLVLKFVTHSHKNEESKKLLFEPVVVYAKRPKKTIQGDLRKFLQRMSGVESGHNSRAVNRSGFLGKYQFSPATIRALGIRTTKENFLSNPELQDSVMLLYMRDNARELRPVIREWSGKTYNGVPVTKSGIIASAHLVGTTGVLAYFYPNKYHHRTSDGNGTTVTMYMQKFNNYNLKL